MDYRIGITGAQGSGKTTLAKYIDKHGDAANLLI